MRALSYWWHSFNVSWMPPPGGFYIGSGGDTFGDVVIEIGRLYISWNWGRPYPREWYDGRVEPWH